MMKPAIRMSEFHAEIADMLKDFCEMEEEVRFYPAYSGRGMFGETCVGIVVKSRETFSLAMRIAQHILSEMEEGPKRSMMMEALSNPSTDSMGLGMIVYWPRIKAA